ncbi:MAG: hypothetical protein GF307_02900 [candidate division Zixibacteria bacterium]|nr:hypothetical protein [candidate division Zixibacteria bacterium]
MKTILFPFFLSALLLWACDNRKPTDGGSGGGGGNGGGGDPEVIYKIDGYAFRDLEDRTDLVWAKILRNGDEYSLADVRFNGEKINHVGNGSYYASDYGILEEGDNTFRVVIVEDNFDENLEFTIPDSFRINDHPRHNPGGQARMLEWTPSQQATGFFFSVKGRNSEANNVAVYDTIIPAQQYFKAVPDTAFRNPERILIPDIYVIHVIAVTSGLTPFSGVTFPVPDLPGYGFPGIEGNFSAGLLAPPDSFIVTF